MYLKFSRNKIDVLKCKRGRERIEKLSETLAALQKPQVYQISDQWIQLFTKSSKRGPYMEGSWHKPRYSLNRTCENKSSTRFLVLVCLMA